MNLQNFFLNPTAIEELFLFILFIFARVIGLFILSPFLSNAVISVNLRFFLALATALLLGMVLYPDFFGPNSKSLLPETPLTPIALAIYVVSLCVKEVAIGYVIGFFLNLMFEAMMFVGEIIDNLAGFATSQYIDPIYNTFQTLTGQLLLMVSAMLMLILDFHHLFVQIVTLSFNLIPLGNFHFNPEFLAHVTRGMSLVFIYTLKIATLPLIVLACGIWGVACTVRVVPEMNLLATGLPMRILLAYGMLILALSSILAIFQEGFQEIIQLVNITLRN